MFKKKKTNNENVFNEHELKTIKETTREHTELDDFIEWLNKKCFLEKWQICGIRKIKYDESRNCYIGFLLNNRFTDKPERNYDFTIYGFLSCDPHHTPVYRAHLKEQLSERPIGITKQLFLSENGIDLTVFAICCEKKKPLVSEDIGRTKRKQDLYSKTAKKNRRISMFASKKIRTLTESKSFKYSVDVTFVNPAYTSQTGKVKYMRRFGMSIHEAAAYVIGRRGLGIIDRLPLIYRQQLKREHASLPRLTQWARAYRFAKAVQAAAMYQVDELPF